MSIEQAVNTLASDLSTIVQRAVRERVQDALADVQLAIEGKGRASEPVAYIRMGKRNGGKWSARPRKGQPSPLAVFRSSTTLERLAERVYSVIKANPGNGTAWLARRLGTETRHLARPLLLLKHAGRIYQHASRNRARYYPFYPYGNITPL